MSTKALRRVRGIGDVPVTDEMSKVMLAIKKKFGEQAIVKGNTIQQPWRIPTGIFQFDLATLGGIPHDRISMVHGPKHSGKSFISDKIIAAAQISMPDQQVVKIDAEQTHEDVWSSKIGVDNSKLHVVQPESGEAAIDIAVALVHAKEVSLIVVDSLAALVPLKEQDSDAGDAHVALQSRLITSMLRKMTAAQITERHRGHHVTVLLVNQQRTKIGGWSPTGDPISLPGGKALGHFTTLEWRMKNKETVNRDERGEDTLAFNEHAFTIEKNKLNAGFRSGEFRMLRRPDDDLGLQEAAIDDASLMLSYAKSLGWYTGGAGRAGVDLKFGDYDNLHASKADDMIRTLYSDPDYFWALRCHLLAAEAERQGMKPWFVEYLRTGEATR